LNKLRNETSPYLKQHETNPVDWYPWGEEALEKARLEDKPILVSIGYSACHWCHVMAHECFENEHLAGIMNAYFVNIKVDREERPDVDSVYMDALQAMGLRGGWPLNVFLMPDAKPFYGGTYFPPQNWQNILLGIQNAFVTEREKLQESADSFANSLNTKDSVRLPNFDLSGKNSAGWSEEELDLLFSKLKVQFDPVKGGLDRAPKFPMPSIWQFLLAYLQTKEDLQLEIQLKLTLNRIVLGGIYDHVGGGWTRYSTDAEWKVPHFEKMLYDNGQLLELYSTACRYFRNKGVDEIVQLYEWAVTKTIKWLRLEMMHPQGGFYSALDADSEGEEGKYYLWTKQELQVLTGSEVLDLYKISEQGNWEHGNNILHLEEIPSKEIWEKALVLHSKLAELSAGRVRPGLDNKLLCGWNSLIINGLCKSYEVFGEEDVLKTAEMAADFIQVNLMQEVGEDGNKALALWHMYSEDRNKIPFGFLDDYAATIKAFTSLYQVCFNIKWLKLAEQLARYAIANFYDAEEGLFYFTDVLAEQLIARKKEIYDNVIPASNSLLANALFDLGVLLSDNEYTDLAASMFGRVRKLAVADPTYMACWAKLGLKINGNIPEVVIVGENAEVLRRELSGRIHRAAYFAGSTVAESELLLLRDRYVAGKTLIYVCRNSVCQLPVSTVEEALTQIYEL
jgi:uncharacterized protein YyaL (SSP411 family)